MTNDETWLGLLLSDAPLEAFEEHRRALLASPGSETSRSTVEREAGTALRLKARLIQHEKRTAELAALNDIASRLTMLHDRHHLLREIVDQAKRLLDVDLAYLALADEDGQHMRIEVASGTFTPQLLGLRLPLHAGLAGRVITESIPSWTRDYATETGFEHASSADAAARAEDIRSLLGVPLTLRGKAIGALLASERRERRFPAEEIALLSALAAQAAIAIDNAGLLSGYQHSLDRLNEMNAELGARTTELQRTIQWQQTLTQVVLRGGSVPDLLREVSSLFSGDVRFTEDPTDTDPASDVDPNQLEAAFGSPGTTDGTPSSVVFGSGDGYVCVVGVLAGGRRLGLLVLRTQRRPNEAERGLLESTAPAIALTLTAEQAVAEAASRAQGAFLEDLLANPGRDEPTQARQARLAGVDLTATYDVMVISGDGTPTTTLRRTVLEFTRGRGCCVAERAAEFIVVAPAGTTDRLIATWSDATIQGRPTCGVAGPAMGAEALAHALVEARRVVAALRVLGREGDTATAQDLGIYRALLAPMGRREVTEMTETFLGLLRRERGRSGVPLERTLEVFFEQAQKYRRTADVLGIHVNTLYQRLETITNLLGEGWSHPDRAFELQTALRMRRLAAQLDHQERDGQG